MLVDCDSLEFGTVCRRLAQVLDQPDAVLSWLRIFPTTLHVFGFEFPRDYYLA